MGIQEALVAHIPLNSAGPWLKHVQDPHSQYWAARHKVAHTTVHLLIQRERPKTPVTWLHARSARGGGAWTAIASLHTWRGICGAAEAFRLHIALAAVWLASGESPTVFSSAAAAFHGATRKPVIREDATGLGARARRGWGRRGRRRGRWNRGHLFVEEQLRYLIEAGGHSWVCTSDVDHVQAVEVGFVRRVAVQLRYRLCRPVGEAGLGVPR